MSSLSPKVRKALFGKLNVASVIGTGKLTGFHYALAPETAKMPYGIFQRISNSVAHAFGLTVAMEDDLYLIKTLSDKQSVKPDSPQGFNETMLDAIETAIGNTLTLTGGGQVLAVYRLRDMPEYVEDAPDNRIFHNGFYLRVAAAE